MTEYRTRTGIIITSTVQYMPRARIPGIPNKNKWLLCLDVTVGHIKLQIHFFSNKVSTLRNYDKAVDTFLPELFPDSVPPPPPEQISVRFKVLKRTIELLLRKKIYMVEVKTKLTAL